MSFGSELGNKISECETAEHGLSKPLLRSCTVGIGFFLAASDRGPVVRGHWHSSGKSGQVPTMLVSCNQLGKQSKGRNWSWKEQVETLRTGMLMPSPRVLHLEPYI